MTEKTSNILYYVGLFLLALGGLGLTFAAFFAIFGLPIFIVGVILVLASLRKAWKHRLLPIGLFILGIFAFWPVWKLLNSVGPETFLIPKNYQGRVNIIFKEGCGMKLEKTHEGIVYKIPEDGILVIDDVLKTGFIEHSYFYVDKEGNLTEIPKMDVRDFNEEWTLEKNPNEPPRNQLGIFHWGRTGGVGDIINGKGEVTNKREQYDYLEFYVSTYNDLTEKFGFNYEQKCDANRNEKVKLCK